MMELLIRARDMQIWLSTRELAYAFGITQKHAGAILSHCRQHGAKFERRGMRPYAEFMLQREGQ